MNVVTFFVADSQAALLEQPSEDAFDHAAVFSQTAAVLRISFGDVRRDVALSQRSANFLFGVVATIGEGFVRPSPPSGRLMKGMASISGIACSESCTFAPVWTSASGVPWPSQTT